MATIKQQIAAITAHTASIRSDREELKAELDAMDCALCGYESPNHFMLCANHPENIEDRIAMADFRRSRCGSPSISWCNEDGCGRCAANESAVTA